MSMVNMVHLIGRFGTKPELVVGNDQNMIIRGSFCTNEHFKDEQGNRQEKDYWHNVVGFGKVAKLINDHVNKGVLIKIEGRLQTRSYVDKAGATKYTTEVIIENILFLQPKTK